MVNKEEQETIRYLFNTKKISISELARLYKHSRTTIRAILNNSDPCEYKRNDKLDIDESLLLDLFVYCKGYRQRMWEILTEEHSIDIGYSTFTRLLREKNIGVKVKQRMGDYPDIAGCEMQHDTSEYKVLIDDRKIKVICSALYYRFSKIRYVRFYIWFNRFTMKCFFHEALLFYGYTAAFCVIDNTHLAVLHGTGADAVMVKEMKSFADMYGFKWKAHEKGHANRKAGEERNFRTINTNFFPGRTFKSLEDLNHQAFLWATERYANRPQTKTRIIPKEAFEFEKAYLIPVSKAVPAPYKTHPNRKIDPKGYITFNANYFWTPEGTTGVTDVLEYSDSIKIIKNHKTISVYDKPNWGVKNKKITPDGKQIPLYEPKHIKKGCDEEERQLALQGEVVKAYLYYIKELKELYRKSQFIRELYTLSKKMCQELFQRTIKRALEYHIHSINEIKAIAFELLKGFDSDPSPINTFELSHDFQNRKAYQQGRFSSEQDTEYLKGLQEGNCEQKNEEETDEN